MGVSATYFEEQSETPGEEQSRKPVINSDGVNFASVDPSLFHTCQGSAKPLSNSSEINSLADCMSLVSMQ